MFYSIVVPTNNSLSESKLGEIASRTNSIDTLYSTYLFFNSDKFGRKERKILK